MLLIVHIVFAMQLVVGAYRKVTAGVTLDGLVVWFTGTTPATTVTSPLPPATVSVKRALARLGSIVPMWTLKLVYLPVKFRATDMTVVPATEQISRFGVGCMVPMSVMPMTVLWFPVPTCCVVLREYRKQLWTPKLMAPLKVLVLTLRMGLKHGPVVVPPIRTLGVRLVVLRSVNSVVMDLWLLTRVVSVAVRLLVLWTEVVIRL